MPDLKDDPTFSEKFAKTSRAEVSANEAASWNPELSRDPCLLVPVDLQALVVGTGDNVEHADVASRLLQVTRREDVPDDGGPPPFTDAAKRPPGVYLHWALPDGLTAGSAAPGGELVMPPLPDRWLILRLERSERKRRIRGWVVESERGVVHRLQGWREGRGNPPPSALRPEDLTAVVGGDLAWTAVFDSAENRFAYYDDLKGPPPLPGVLAYLVMGWYSVRELDPLHPLASPLSFDERMRKLGWTVDEARLEGARAEAARLRDAVVETLDLDAKPLTVAGIDTSLEVEGAREPVDVPANEVAPPVLEGSEQVDVKVEPWRPQRSIFHGTVYGIFAGVGGREDPKPASADLRVAVGGTASESLARLVADALGGDLAATERLQTAFAYELVDTFDRPDGIPRLEEEIHLRGFGSAVGGARVEQVRTGDPLEAAPGGKPKGSGPPPRDRGRGKKPRLEFTAARYDEVLDQFARATRPEAFTPSLDPVRAEAAPRAGPRYFFPEDPVLMVQGLKRSLRHGFDGRFEPDERLACRLSGDPIASYAGLVQGIHLLENRLDHGGIPREASELLNEAVLEDPFTADDVADVAAERTGHQPDAVRRRMKAERQLLLRSQEAGTDAPRLTAFSLKHGVEPSPVATTIYRQPWIPLFFEWELELALEETINATRWQLGELDYELKAPVTATVARQVRGRTLLSATAAKVFASQVNRFLEQEDRLDLAGQGIVEEPTEELLRTTAVEAEYLDVLTGAFDGLRERLLGFGTNLGDWTDDEGSAGLAVPLNVPLLLWAGTAKLTKARAVDAFGRFVEFAAADLQQVLVSEPLRPPPAANAAPGSVLLAPRIPQLSRLHFRLLDAEDDAQEAVLNQAEGSRSPVAGWLLPDHVDGAVEFFDQAGNSAGQLRHEALGGGVIWESAPGTAPAFGAAPGEAMTNRHLIGLATALVQRDAADRAAGTTRSESPLSALLRVIDSTLWTVDPFGQSGTEHLSMLLGRPVAVVRAHLRLEVENDADHYPLPAAIRLARLDAYAELARKLFEVRLGALSRFEDGLLAYFVDDDYRTLFPVHAMVVDQALPSGPRTGFLGAAGDPGAPLAPQPIVQPYLEADPTVSLRPAQTVRLTLLMDPGSKVHVTTGILPRKFVALLRDWIAPPLSRLSPSFRMGPVLVDPVTVQMPLAAGLPKEQLWSRRDTPLRWRDDPIVAATNEPVLPEQSPVAQEGYIRARPAED